MIDFIRPHFEDSSSIENRLKDLAEKTADFLRQDELGHPAEQKIAANLVSLLKNVPQNEWDRLLNLYATEAVKSYGISLPSVTEDVQTAIRIARNWLENPENSE